MGIVDIQSRQLVYSETMDLGNVVLVCGNYARGGSSRKDRVLDKSAKTLASTLQAVWITDVSRNLSKRSCTTSPTLSSTLGIGRSSGLRGRLLLVGIWSSAKASSSLCGALLSDGGPPGLAEEPLCKVVLF